MVAGALPQLKVGLGVRPQRPRAGQQPGVCRRPDLDFSDRDYFKVHVAADIGTFIGQSLIAAPALSGRAVLRRQPAARPSADGRFAGVIQASVFPEYFESFYARIGPRARRASLRLG